MPTAHEHDPIGMQEIMDSHSQYPGDIVVSMPYQNEHTVVL